MRSHASADSFTANSPRPKTTPNELANGRGNSSDTGIISMLQAMFDLGAERSRLIIKAAGAAKVVENLNLFKIAERNHTVFRKLMWKNELLITAEEVGGDRPRTMSIDIADGATWLQVDGAVRELGASRLVNAG
ncbi:MAG: chemotaxis protein CheD [Pirellulales bacterium]